MNLSDLLNENRIRKTEPDKKQALECIKVAERDIRVAKKLMNEDLDWAFSVSYNASLQAVRALMFSEGYYTIGENHHKTTVDYAIIKFGQKFKDSIELFDRMRKKRHEAVYFNAGVISKFEAEKAMEFANFILSKVKEKIC